MLLSILNVSRKKLHLSSYEVIYVCDASFVSLGKISLPVYLEN